MQQHNQRTALILTGVVIGMIGLSFASVPLYSLFCKMTGYGGTTQTAQAFPAVQGTRQIDVLFDARTDSGLPWDFKPEIRHVKVAVGQQGMISFTATNLSAQNTVGTALYNVTPDKAGKYFFKTQCFCFAEQVLPPGKTAHFPVIFYIDPTITDDPELADVTDITLSYTFFPANSKNFDKAMRKLTEAKK